MELYMASKASIPIAQPDSFSNSGLPIRPLLGMSVSVRYRWSCEPFCSILSTFSHQKHFKEIVFGSLCLTRRLGGARLFTEV